MDNPSDDTVNDWEIGATPTAVTVLDATGRAITYRPAGPDRVEYAWSPVRLVDGRLDWPINQIIRSDGDVRVELWQDEDRVLRLRISGVGHVTEAEVPSYPMDPKPSVGWPAGWVDLGATTQER